MLKKQFIPSLLIILLGTADCVTTVIGTAYGAKELNPLLVGIVSNVGIFMLIKIASTVFVASTYLVSRHILLQMPNKTGKSYGISFKMLNIVYAGIVIFLVVVVINNLFILF